jgi:GNAT superfamily N-acetyltransferase
VKVKCFGCAAIIEAADSDSVVQAFVSHAHDEHDWSYPEEAIRNYARNCAEAVGRLTGSTERLPAIGNITVYPVTADRVDDWLRFFDHDAFADNFVVAPPFRRHGGASALLDRVIADASARGAA